MTRKRKSTEPYSERHLRRLAKREALALLNQIDLQFHTASSSHENANSSSLQPVSSYSADYNYLDDGDDSDFYRYSSCDTGISNDESNDESIANMSSNQENEENVNQSQVESNIIEMVDDNINSMTFKERKQNEFTNKIVRWAIEHKVTHAAISDLLIILNQFTDVSFPKHPRTLLKTPVNTHIQDLGSGLYCHLGLKEAISKIMNKREKLGHKVNNIELLISMDGAPIGKSADKSLWPILCSDTIVKDVHIIGIYHGEGKPDDANEYLQMFVSEATELVNNGFPYNHAHIQVKIHALICDAPAKAFVLGVKYHSGYSSCTKCEIEGDFIDNCVCFPGPIGTPRTDEGFRNYSYRDDYQIKETILNNIPEFGLVSNVVLDYMHLVCLGVVKKLILLWLNGPLSVRLSAAQIAKISDLMKDLRKVIPSEFARKPRPLKFVRLWKATEFRNFLLYIGPVVLKDILCDAAYVNFLTLHVAISILASPILVLESQNILYAQQLLNHFVESFEKIYGARHVSYNVHNLLHLAADVQKFGSLDSFSAFRFENYISTIKTFIRKGELPLPQIARRLAEMDNALSIDVQKDFNLVLDKPHSSGPLLNDRIYTCQYHMLKMRTYSIMSNESNNCVLLKSGVIVLVLNFTLCEDESYLIGKELINDGESLYCQPCESTKIGIQIVTGVHSEIKSWSCTEVSGKMFKMPLRNKFVVFPISHTLKLNISSGSRALHMMYSIIEFWDGLEMVPSSWLIEPEKKKCKWPPYNDDVKIRKAVSKMATPENSWGLCDVIKILATAGTYAVGIEKLKLAEQLSDIDDTVNPERWKKTRSNRARKIPAETSSDEEIDKINSQKQKHDLQSFPKVPESLAYHKPLDETQSQLQKSMKSSSSEKTRKSDVSKNATRLRVQSNILLLEGGDNGEQHPIGGEKKRDSGQAVQDTTSRDKNFDVNYRISQRKDSSKRDENVCSIQHSNNIDTTAVDSTGEECGESIARRNDETIGEIATLPLLDQDDKLNLLIKLTKALVQKQSSMNITMRSIEKKISEIEKKNIPRAREQLNPGCTGEFEQLFPLDSEEKLKDFEIKLNDGNTAFKSEVIRYFRNRGGKDTHELISMILKNVLSNDVALKYSYLGQKNKKNFGELQVCKCVERAAELHDPDVKKTDVKDLISKWLVQANLRIKNDNKKKRNRTENNTANRQGLDDE